MVSTSSTSDSAGSTSDSAGSTSDGASSTSDGFRQAQPTTLPGWTHAYSGKVRDLFVPSGQDLATAPRILVVASDRVSAFDHVLEPGIPGKGALLTRLSTWWFARLGVANHLRDADSTTPPVPESIAASSMLVANLDMFPIEAVVRGCLTGSGWQEYQQTQSVCGVALPAGLHDGDKLPKPIFTPAWKAPLGEHDENISFERTVELVGADDAAAIRDLSLRIFASASAIAAEREVILADTKFEFGRDRETGQICLADEVLTSDSSRYWDAREYAAGDRGLSFDKQIVRDWLSDHWNKKGTPPALPAEIVSQTAGRYADLIERLTG